MHIIRALRERLKFCRGLYLWGWRWVVFVGWALPWGGTGAYDLLRGQGWFPDSWPLLSHVIPSWGYLLWILLGAVVFIIVTIEGAYRVCNPQKPKLMIEVGNSEEFETITVEPDENGVRWKVLQKVIRVVNPSHIAANNCQVRVCKADPSPRNWPAFNRNLIWTNPPSKSCDLEPGGDGYVLLTWEHETIDMPVRIQTDHYWDATLTITVVVWADNFTEEVVILDMKHDRPQHLFPQITQQSTSHRKGSQT